MNNMMQGIVNISNKNAPTRGTTKNAFSDGPYFWVTEVILANALGVAPSPWPISPLIITAASKFFPRILKQ